MIINEFDKVLLKDGRKADIVDILEPNKAFMVDIEVTAPNWEKDEYPEWETVQIFMTDIEKVLPKEE